MPDRHNMEFNDVHSRLNPAFPSSFHRPRSAADVAELLASATPGQIAICAGRHAMGGQQFIDKGLQIDMQSMDRVVQFETGQGHLTVEAGIQWPALMAFLDTTPANHGCDWGIRQKQTGADRFSIGGSLSANIHGRGLCMKPFVDDIEAFTMVDAQGRLVECDRSNNAELFSLTIGGYGLLGVVVSITLRLGRHFPVVREVEVIPIEELASRVAERIADDCNYGDFQFDIDSQSDGFLRIGILSCYRRLPHGTPLTPNPIHMSGADWSRLLKLAHVDKSAAFLEFKAFYLRSSGQIYRSDQHQAGYYLDGYHDEIDACLGHVGTEVISELYVPRTRLIEFMQEAARELRAMKADVIYGTVRLVERDDETVLAWAREPWACVIFNLHAVHTEQGIEHTARCKKMLIDLAIACSGSYYLTYHRHASRGQLLSAHPRFPDFVQAKRRHDPLGRFSSSWYRHYEAAGLE